ATSMGTDQLGKAFSKHAPTTPRIGTTKSPDQQLDVDRPAVSGQIHQQPCIAAVPATGDATAQRARRSRSGALGGDGNVCRGKFLLPDDQTDASKKSPHTAKPRSKRSQRGSRLSSKLLLPAAALHRTCGRPSLSPPITRHNKHVGAWADLASADGQWLRLPLPVIRPMTLQWCAAHSAHAPLVTAQCGSETLRYREYSVAENWNHQGSASTSQPLSRRRRSMAGRLAFHSVR